MYHWITICFAALYPVCQETDTADRNTREHLHPLIDILLNYVMNSNDQKKKILDFLHPLNKLLKKLISAAVAEQTKAPLFSWTVFVARGSGSNPVAATICYSENLWQITNSESPPSHFFRYVLKCTWAKYFIWQWIERDVKLYFFFLFMYNMLV